MATTVANRKQVKTLGENDVYIGRRMQGYWNVVASVWANPYRIGRDGTRAEVIAKYERHIRAELNRDVELRRQLLELKDKRLICWCHPLECHGDVLVKLIAEYEAWLAKHPGKH